MKKAALVAGLAAAAATAATAAQAQTQVQIYGIMDAAIVGEHGGNASPSTKITSGAASASRIGFRGTEDLGNGLSAFFTLETGAKIDTGELDASNTIFNRQAFVGLKSRAGEVALGRQYTPWHLALVAIDPFGTGYAGTSKNLFPDNGSNVRTSNTITYKSPKVNGFDGELAYSVGEQSVSSAGRQFGGAVGYAAGPLVLRRLQQQEHGRRRHRDRPRRQPHAGPQYLVHRRVPAADGDAALRLRHRQGLQQRHAGEQQQPLRRREADPVDGRPRRPAGPVGPGRPRHPDVLGHAQGRPHQLRPGRRRRGASATCTACPSAPACTPPTPISTTRTAQATLWPTIPRRVPATAATTSVSATPSKEERCSRSARSAASWRLRKNCTSGAPPSA
jgi:opacity protein-like surface antigen